MIIHQENINYEGSLEKYMYKVSEEYDQYLVKGRLDRIKLIK
jgi:hypothetical protein